MPSMEQTGIKQSGVCYLREELTGMGEGEYKFSKGLCVLLKMNLP